jgi:D-alanine-D-alanine ligase
MNPNLHIAVLFGGNNSEREVSIATASQVANALRQRGHSVVAIDTATGVLSEDDEESLFQQKVRKTQPNPSELAKLHDQQTWVRLVDTLHPFDLVFIALHGSPAEDGKLQSLLELSGIRHTGSGALGSSLAWHKNVAKEIFIQNGIATAPWVEEPSVSKNLVEQLGLPLIIKPSGEGSTTGITLVKQEHQIESALQKAYAFGGVIAETFIKGREITVGVLNDKALGVGEINIDPNSTFTYDLKYQQGAVTETFPADLPAKIYNQAQEIALAAHKALKLSGYSRSDFRLDEQGKIWLMEVNSLPGLTSTSLMPQSAAVVGIKFSDLCEEICQKALNKLT